MVAIAWKGSFLIEKGKLGSCSLPYAHTVHIAEDKCLLLLTPQGKKINRIGTSHKGRFINNEVYACSWIAVPQASEKLKAWEE